MLKLWEVKHPYYCSDSNYYAPPSEDLYSKYERWSDFIDAEGSLDMELNLLFRWDWQKPTDEDGEEVAFDLDPNFRDCILQLFILQQRKGIFRCSEIEVCAADEPVVREWLKPRWEKLKSMWEPIV